MLHRCPSCRYDLFGLHDDPVRCPECGRSWTRPALIRAAQAPSPWWSLCGLIWSPVLMVALALVLAHPLPRPWRTMIPLAAGFLPAWFFCAYFFAAWRTRAGRPRAFWTVLAGAAMAAAFVPACVWVLSRLLAGA